MEKDSTKPSAGVAASALFVGENWFDPLEAAVRVSALLALLIPPVGFVALPAPDSGPTRCATIALATIATDANSEYCPALRAATSPQPKDTTVNGRIRHQGIMPSPGGPRWVWQLS